MGRKMGSSKFFNLILSSLKKKNHKHMLRWTSEPSVFVVEMVNKKWKKYDEKYLSLFEECDKVMKKENKRLEEKENYSEKTKGRFRANMNRLEKSKYVKKLHEQRVGCQSVKYIYYRILKHDKKNGTNETPTVTSLDVENAGSTTEMGQEISALPKESAVYSTGQTANQKCIIYMQMEISSHENTSDPFVENDKTTKMLNNMDLNRLIDECIKPDPLDDNLGTEAIFQEFYEEDSRNLTDFLENY